jgi:hypothetical protein
MQSGGISGRTQTNCSSTPCNQQINQNNNNTSNNAQQQFLPSKQHFNVPIGWNETNIPIQQMGESQQQSKPVMLYYSPAPQQFQQRQQHFVDDINNSHAGIIVSF